MHYSFSIQIIWVWVDLVYLFWLSLNLSIKKVNYLLNSLNPYSNMGNIIIIFWKSNIIIFLKDFVHRFGFYFCLASWTSVAPFPLLSTAHRHIKHIYFVFVKGAYQTYTYKYNNACIFPFHISPKFLEKHIYTHISIHILIFLF